MHTPRIWTDRLLSSVVKHLPTYATYIPEELMMIHTVGFVEKMKNLRITKHVVHRLI
jgi:hypothetical protein